MANSIKVMGGREWTRDRDGKNAVTVKYRCVLDAPIAEDGEGVDIPGVPKPGAEHPTDDTLEVAKVSYSEEASVGGQFIVVATVSYEKKASSEQTTTQEEGGIVYRTDEWGWDAGTEEKELLNDVDSTQQNPKPVVNSAGDPFDSVPKVSVYAPTFTKVMKFKERRSGAIDFNGKVNGQELTIGGKTCPVGTLLCSVAEKRIFGDPDWNYAYTIQLKFKSNTVKIFGDTTSSELGWDVAVADLGMRQKDPNDSTGKKRVLIRQRDQETQEMCVVSSPTLLDGHGYAISETDTDRSPRNLRFKAYHRGTFPNWFYSEPPIAQPEPEPEPEE